MEIIYLNEKDFNKVKATETFPNKNVKKGFVNGIEYSVHKTCLISIFKVQNQEEANWYGVALNTFIGRASDGFFPTQLIAGVKNRAFSSDSELSRITGFVLSRNLGSASLAFTNLEATKKILEENNFEVVVLNPVQAIEPKETAIEAGETRNDLAFLNLL